MVQYSITFRRSTPVGRVKTMWMNRARWVTDKYILLMLGLFPLVWGSQGYGNITRTKFLFFLIATCLWLGVTAVFWCVAAARKEGFVPRVRPAHIAMAVFLASGAVSAALSEYGVQCLMGLGRYDGYVVTLLYGLIFFGVSWLGKPNRGHAWALGLSVGFCSVVCWLQLAGLDPFGLYPEGTNYYDKYVAFNGAFMGTIGNAGLVSAFLCMGVPFLTAFALLSEHRRDRLLLLPAVLGLGILLLCDIDAGILALGVTVLVGVPVVIRGRKPRRIAACAAGGIAALGLGTVYFLPGKSRLLYEFSQVLHGHLADEFGSHRGQIWKRCWELFLEKPWFGGGPGTAAKRFDILWTGEHRSTYVDNAHNVYLGHLVNMGLIAALSYIAAAVCSLLTWLRRRDESPLFAALGCGFLCFLVQDFFGLGLSLTEPILFVAWGLLETE